MSHVDGVTALQVRDPILRLIEVEADDATRRRWRVSHEA